jgi:hypothetical protein
MKSPIFRAQIGCLNAKTQRRKGDFRVSAPAALITDWWCIAAGALTRATSLRLCVFAFKPASFPGRGLR